MLGKFYSKDQIQSCQVHFGGTYLEMLEQN